MKKVYIFLALFSLSLLLAVLYSCTEEDTNSESDLPFTTRGDATFWIASDFGCGPITVNCGGFSQSITGFFSTITPSCGASGSANFNLEEGTYPFTASCSSKTWSGSINIAAGGCSRLQLTSSGGNTGSGGIGTGTGQAIFWTASDLGVGSITVTCNGSTRTVSSYYSSGAPSCGASGAANFTLNPGTYSYSASGGSLTWSGTINITIGGCSKLQLTGNGTGGGGTGGGGTPGTSQVLFSQCVEGNEGDKKIVIINVPANVKKMTIETSEENSCWRNTADMFVRKGSSPTVTKLPTYSWTADCAGIKPNRENESCTFNNPGSGQWYIMLYGYNTYFSSNLKVTVFY